MKIERNQTLYTTFKQEAECLGKASPKRSEVELLCESVCILEKVIDELSCKIEPILHRPTPEEKMENPIMESTSPLMEKVRDCRGVIEAQTAKINDLISRVQF